VLQERVGGEHGVVRLNNRRRDLGAGVDGERELALLAIIHTQTLQKERAETRSSSTANRVEDKEALKTSALISKLSDAIKAEIDDLLSDGVVTTGVVVSGILLAGDQLLGVEELAVGTSSALVNDGGLQVEEDATGDVLAGTSLREEGVEGIILAANGLVRGHLSIRLDAVLEAEELPASVSDLHAGLANMKRNNFTHF